MKLKCKYIITSASLFVIPFLLSALTLLIKKESEGVFLRTLIFSIILGFINVFIYLYSHFTGKLDYDNDEHPLRYLITYGGCFLLACSFVFIDKNGWIYLSIGIALSLFSDSLCGLTGLASMLTLSCLLSNSSSITFFVYFAACLLGIAVFRDIDQNFNVSSSIIISSVSLLILETAGFILLENKKLSTEQFIIPIVNIAINVIALVFILKYFNLVVANRYRNKFLELNDQEYKELQKLKETSKEEYFRSIHTAYLAERMASSIGCDVDVAKNCAYYHRIKQVFNLTGKECEQFTIDNNFPPKAKDVLLEFLDRRSKLINKESCIVYLSDKLISTILGIFKKDPAAKVNYSEIINSLMEKESTKETLKDSDLSYKDFRAIKKVMLDEQLYYDFLR